jgi:hypothetical protein
MREVIADIVKHTGGLGFIEIVKISSSDEDNAPTTKIEAMDNDKTVIIKGQLLETVEEFTGEFGMTNLSLIKGLVDHPNFKTDEATLKVVKEEDASSGVISPVEILFDDGKGQTANYRFMSSQLVPSQAKFLGTTWDVTLSPSKTKIAEFSSFAALYSFENLFMADTHNGNLRFNIGDPNGNSHRTSLIFEEGVKGKLASGLYWPIDRVLSILKLGVDSTTTMAFSQKGALMITLENEIGKYSYILPAKKR